MLNWALKISSEGFVLFQTCTRVYAILLLYFMVRFEGLYFLFQVFLNRELAVFERSSSLDQLFMIDFDILISPQDSSASLKIRGYSPQHRLTIRQSFHDQLSISLH